jgi:hypothetical protein
MHCNANRFALGCLTRLLRSDLDPSARPGLGSFCVRVAECSSSDRTTYQVRSAAEGPGVPWGRWGRTWEAEGTATCVLVLRFGRFEVRAFRPTSNRCSVMPALPALGSLQGRHRNYALLAGDQCPPYDLSCFGFGRSCASDHEADLPPPSNEGRRNRRRPSPPRRRHCPALRVRLRPRQGLRPAARSRRPCPVPCQRQPPRRGLPSSQRERSLSASSSHPIR